MKMSDHDAELIRTRRRLKDLEEWRAQVEAAIRTILDALPPERAAAVEQSAPAAAA
jgi:hypothetical protein